MEIHRKDVAVLAIRIIVLYLLITILIQAGSILAAAPYLFSSQGFADFGSRMALLGGLPAMTLFLLVAGGLWRYAPGLAEWMLPEAPPREEETAPGPITLPEVQTFCISLFGLYLLATTLPVLAKVVFAVLLPNLDTSYSQTVANGLAGGRRALIPYSNLVYLAVKLAIGAWLTFGSQGIRGLVNRVRGWGQATS